MKNLTELLRTVELIANHRYDGDVFISKVSRAWRVEFHHKDICGNGVMLVLAGEGSTLEQALRQTCEAEISKAQDDLNLANVFMKCVKSGGG